MRFAIIIVVTLAALVVGCGDNDEHAPIDAPDEIDAGVDAAVDASPSTLGACLDRPTDLARPPAGRLPCELVPPGLLLQL